MRNCIQDEAPIRAVYIIELNVRIVDPKIPTFADQMLKQCNHGAFAEVISVLL